MRPRVLAVSVVLLLISIPGASAESQPPAGPVPELKFEKKLDLPANVQSIHGSLFSPTAVRYRADEQAKAAVLGPGGAVEATLDLPKGAGFATSENGRFAAVSLPDPLGRDDYRLATVYELPSVRKLWTRRGLWGSILISDDGKMVVFASVNPMQRFLLEFCDGEGNVLRRIGPSKPEEGDRALASLAKRFVVGGRDGTVKLYDGKGQELATFNPGAGSVRKLAISPDGSRIVAQWLRSRQPDEKPGDELATVCVLDNNLDVVAKQEGVDLWLNQIAFSPDGSHFAATIRGALQLHESTTGRLVWRRTAQELAPQEGRSAQVNGSVVGNRGERVVALCSNALSQSPRGRSIVVLDKEGKAIASRIGWPAGGMEFSPDNKELALGTEDAVFYYPLPDARE